MGEPPPKGVSQYCQKQDRSGNLVRHGRYTEWYGNGKVKEKSYYKDGALDGLFESFYENGARREREVRKELKLHERSSYKPDGSWERSLFEDGKSNGVVESYFKNGRIKQNRGLS